MKVYIVIDTCCGCDDIRATAYRTEVDALREAGKYGNVIEVEVAEPEGA